jgi:hypothetical protein
MQIDLVYFEGCPHADAARQRLREVLASLGSSAEWTEWDTQEAATPSHLRGYSSPSILVNGIDVARQEPTSGAACALEGGPSVETLRGALMAAGR